MGIRSLNPIFFIAVERIAFGEAVDCAAVDRAVDLAASVIFWGPGAKGVSLLPNLHPLIESLPGALFWRGSPRGAFLLGGWVPPQASSEKGKGGGPPPSPGHFL